MEKPWYNEGLTFKCTQCGNCCTGDPGFVWIDEAEIGALAEYLNEPYDQVKLRYTRQVGGRRSLREKSNNDCVFYDRDKGCTVYAVRPRQCRTWPFWQTNVASPEAWRRTCEECPGAGQGDLISAEEITQRIRLIRL